MVNTVVDTCGTTKAPLARLRRGSFAIVGLVLIIASCSQVPVASSDSSPPTAYWIVTETATSNRTITNGSDASSNVTVNGDAIVTFLVEDSGGVQHIRLYEPATAQTCVKGDVISGGTPGFVLEKVMKETINSPDEDGLVYDELFLLTDAFVEGECNAGWTLSSRIYEFRGSGNNFHGGNVESFLRLTLLN